MAEYDGSIRINVEIDKVKAEKQLDRLADGAADISDGFKDAEKSALSFGDVLSANILSDAVLSGFSQLTDALGGFVSDSVSAAAELKAQTSQFEQAFGTMEGTATDAISGIAEETGILDTRLRDAATSIYSFARASGGSEMESMSLMEGALSAAADAAAYYDRSLEDTTGTLMSFLKGNFENDAALGLSATETTRNAAAMEEFGQKFSDLSEIQKQQVLLKMVTDAQALSGAMGQAARESDGLENVMGNLHEVGRQIQGNVGAPILEAIVPALQEITSALIKWTEGVDWTVFSDAVGGFITGMIDNGPTIVSIIAGIGAGFLAWKATTMIQGIVSAVSAMIPALTGAEGAQTGLNAAMAANPIGLVVAAVTALTTIIMTLWTTNEDFRNAVTAIWDSIKAAFVGAWEGVKAAWDRATAYFQAIWAAIQLTFAPVVEYLSGIFKTAWENVEQIFSGVIDFLTGVFTGDWDKAWGGVVKIFKGAWNSIVSLLEGAVNLIIDGVNWLISQLNKIHFEFPDWVPGVGGKSFGINIPPVGKVAIPRLATGAVIPPNREFMAVLGDQKSGTNIETPLATMVQAFKQALNESGGGNTTVILELDGQRFGQVVYTAYNKENRRIGVSLAGV